MKITRAHYNYLKAEIDKVLGNYPNLIAEYEAGQFPRSDKVKDLQKRFCYDVMKGAGLSKFVCNELYIYLNDNHIYTALKSIVPTIRRAY
tara:strand:+ start:2732 stop:3001 length:270 start_codon:yes stop_codon:yes gene_type:complete